MKLNTILFGVGNRQCVQLLLRSGALVCICESVSQRTPVHAVAYNGCQDCLPLLLENAECIEYAVNATDRDDK